MLRQRVLQKWEKLKEKVYDLDLLISDYRMCLVITNQTYQPKNHKLEKMLIIDDYDLPDRIMTKHDVQTGLVKEGVERDLTYCYQGRKVSSSSMIVLLWGPPIEEVD